MKDKIIAVSAGDAITAKLVQEAGFSAIWVSGFEASARLGLADNGSICMIEMLNVCKPIVDAVDIPVYVDCDTGYGNFARTVREFERIGVEGICIEDNLPQKENSLWGGDAPLMDIYEFGDKLKVKRNEIKIIARTEAIIRGEGQRKAEIRLKHYIDCGADMVLPHTRDSKLILSPNFFVPVAIVPTKFPHMTNKQLFDMGYSMVIWANQTERVKIKAIREALFHLQADGCAKSIEDGLCASLDDMRGLCPNS